jgi:hypothetical protein
VDNGVSVELESELKKSSLGQCNKEFVCSLGLRGPVMCERSDTTHALVLQSVIDVYYTDCSRVRSFCWAAMVFWLGRGHLCDI